MIVVVNYHPEGVVIDSPYDPQAHYSTKRDTHWLGYKVHLTETCDDDQPHLITHVETTTAPQPDLDMVTPIHEALAQKDCLRDTHLLDAGYIDAQQMVDTQGKYGLNLVGPMRPDTSWQMMAHAGYASQDFQIDWEAQTVFCPRGIASSRWVDNVDPEGNKVIQVRFLPGECRQCPAHELCTRSTTGPRFLTLRPQAVHEALQMARQLQQTDQWQELYASRAGIEGTISQAVRGFGLRHCRYIGLAKTHLQHLLTAAAINLARLDAWFTGQKRAVTRTSSFAALRPAPA